MLFDKITQNVSREIFREQSDETAFFDLGNVITQSTPSDAAIQRLGWNESVLASVAIWPIRFQQGAPSSWHPRAEAHR